MNEALDLFEWYVIRASGSVSLLLLTASLALGVLTRARWSPRNRPRWVTRALHRNVSMLAVAFVAGHVAFTMVQSHADIALADVVVPLAGPSHSLALALGTVAVDLLLAITITSALRRHVGVRAWRAVHATAWGLWPIAALHSVTMGTDAGSWMLWVNLACAAMFAAALGVRRWGGRQSTVSPVVEGAARPASSSAV